MGTFRYAVAIGIVAALLACGPKTVTPKYLLDTPSRHVATGMKFLDKEKREAAKLEFERAVELDTDYAPAWVGLAILEAYEGRFDEADTLLHKAQDLYQTEDHRQFVTEGFRRVDAMRTQAPVHPKK